MSLCIADTILCNDDYIGSDARVRWLNWSEKGMNNAFRFDPSRTESIGLGNNISKSLYAVKNIDNIEDVSHIFHSDSEDAGNGSMMRLAPIPIYYGDTHMAMKIAVLQSYATHPGDDAADACMFMSFFMSRALMANNNTRNISEFTDDVICEFLEINTSKKLRRLLNSREKRSSKEVNWNWRLKKIPINLCIQNRGRQYNGYPVSRRYFGSYSLDALAMALWGIYHSRFGLCPNEVVKQY